MLLVLRQQQQEKQGSDELIIDLLCGGFHHSHNSSHSNNSKSAPLSLLDGNNQKPRAAAASQHVCSEQLREMFGMHDCLLQTSQGGRYPGEEQLALQLQCNATAAPVYQSSFMWGQGFGRIVQHGVKTCLLAALLHRPCAIDLIRDRYHNLRSFVAAGPYDWDRAAQLVNAQHGPNISHALRQMPQGIEKGHGWEPPRGTDATPVTVVPEYADVLPMVWGTEKASAEAVQRHLDLWDGRPGHGSNSNNRRKILLSPNFGDAWYAYGRQYVSVGKEWNDRNNAAAQGDDFCSANRMTTLLQNRMFVPTALARELHRERRAIVLREEEEEEKEQTTVDDKAAATNTAGISTLPEYGAIHLRMFILNRDVYKMNVTKERVVEGLKDCFETLEKDTHGNDIVKKWWLIADDVEVATFVTGELGNVYSYASLVASREESKGGGGGDTISLVRDKAKGAHSGNAMNKKFGQEELAPSVIDWMALHESHVALITHDSAYGETGARGRGKVRGGATCGGRVEKKEKSRSFPLFSIFHKEEPA